jgi:threonylcarbamoyladenosine tRNA methylthiotransferase MtaB
MDRRRTRLTRRIAFKTFGCKANSVDTDSLYLEALKRGYEVVEETDVADAYVVNTCTVTHQADKEARYQIHRFKRLNPEALIGVVGCYAQVAKEELLRLTDIDFVLGTAEKIKILDHFQEAWEGNTKPRDGVLPAKGFLVDEFRGSRHARASIKIQDGCNFRCSFCIIPEARGRSRSLEPDRVLRQVEEAYRRGFEEIVLVGIHLAHYGWDKNTTLWELLKRLLDQPTGPRIRLSTLDPFEIPDAAIDLLGQTSRFCPHFHIALQSGSDRILKAMRRIYAAEQFVTVTRKIEARDPNAFVGVDVIAGFPGEGEEEFQETLACLARSYWTKLHVFSFSPRKGTAAETLPDPVPAPVIAQRAKALRHLSDRRYMEFLNSQVGKKQTVVLEIPLGKMPDVWLGHTANYLPTYSKVKNGIRGKQFEALIERTEKDRVWTS